MKVPLEWVKEFVAIRLPPEELAHRLTMAGLEVAGVERLDGEPVLDLEITPNRADCLSIIGVAREVAALTGATLRTSVQTRGRRPKTRGGTETRSLQIRIEDRKGCRRYIGRRIEGVRMGPSPAWMQQRLAACGVRAINHVVDVTNYVLLERGQPLHAFDASTLGGNAIVVRRARTGEKLIAIDGTACALTPEMLVIADAERPVAVAGVMGGRDTQVQEHTTAVVLESAWFDPILVRRAARALGLASESSYRFERGVDLLGVDAASRRAAALIMQTAGGQETIARDMGAPPPTAVTISLSSARVSGWLGASIPTAQVSGALQALGCRVRRQASGWPHHLSHRQRRPSRRERDDAPSAQRQVVGWRVQVPSFRRDLRQDVDLIEELARVWGYERLPSAIPQVPMLARPSAATPYARAHALKTACAGLGLSEVITWALISEPELAKLGMSGEWISLANPLSRDHAILRPTLIGGLLQVASRNLAQGALGVRCFELGKVFEPAGEDRGVREQLRLGLLLAGSWEQSWQGARASDLFRLKGIAERLADRVAGQPLRAEPAVVPWAQPGRSMRVWAGPHLLGDLGEVAHRVCDAYDCHAPVWIAELDAGALLGAPREEVRAAVPSVFPPVKRDVSFLVDRQAAYAEVDALIRSVGAPLAVGVSLIDRYTGPTIPATHHSLTFAIEYRDPSRTLTAEEVDRLHQRIIHALTERFQIQLR